MSVMREWSRTTALAAIVAAAVAVRLALMPLYAYLPRNSLDEYAWKRWMQAIHDHGVLNVFRTTRTDYVGYHWVLWLLSAEASFVTGAVLPVSGGF